MHKAAGAGIRVAIGGAAAAALVNAVNVAAASNAKHKLGRRSLSAI